MTKKDFYLQCVSTVLMVICFADSPGSTTQEAESTSTYFESLNGRLSIFFLWCNIKYHIYMRARRYVLKCLHVIRGLLLKLLVPYSQLQHQQLRAASDTKLTHKGGTG